MVFFVSADQFDADVFLRGVFVRGAYGTVTGPRRDQPRGTRVNSYALNYHLVDGPLVLMIQVSYGGAYGDKKAEARYANAQFDRCAALRTAVDQAKARGLVGPPGRLYVFESGLRGLAAWGWLDEPLDENAATSWLAQHDTERHQERSRRLTEDELPIDAARKWLETAKFDNPAPYPDRKQRDLSDQEKLQIRHRIERGDDDVHALAREFACAPTQVAAIKAWLKR